MPTKDPRVDAYIAAAPEFARPILSHLRKLIHQGCPEAAETMKWSRPFFEYKGLLCGFAAFKAHCSLFFWQDIDLGNTFQKDADPESGAGRVEKIEKLSDLPKDDVLVACVRSAVQQRDTPKTKAKRVREPVKEVPVPTDLKKAISANVKANTVFKALAPSHRREYINWIVEAKRPETRAKRIQTTVDWLSEGKKLNWKYE
ncbi:MAG TPA: YdeI/OmpD-associated family protein [Opitutaceae bacterium]